MVAPSSINSQEGQDKLMKINLWIASENTWQGVIHGGYWPRMKQQPLKISGDLTSGPLRTYQSVSGTN